jgi:DNA-directed RNA polymerase subunit RPC12/RpoP
LTAIEGPYFGKIAVLPTLHEKDSVIAPIFQTELGIQVQVADIDTDQFGTFAGEIPRTFSQLDAAIAKARAAIASTGVPLAIASEGTIGPNPLIPIASSDLETMVFVDSEQDLVIHETYRSEEITSARRVLRPGDSLDDFLSRADFPAHALIVRTEQTLATTPVKGIRNRAVLVQAIQDLSGDSGSVIVESDLRASFSPSRMRNIAACARLLARRMASICPKCNTAGWGSISPVFGLPCADCGSNVDSAVRSDQYGCGKCEHRQFFARAATVAEARFCDSCNP